MLILLLKSLAFSLENRNTLVYIYILLLYSC